MIKIKKGSFLDSISPGTLKVTQEFIREIQHDKFTARTQPNTYKNYPTAKSLKSFKALAKSKLLGEVMQKVYK